MPMTSTPKLERVTKLAEIAIELVQQGYSLRDAGKEVGKSHEWVRNQLKPLPKKLKNVKIFIKNKKCKACEKVFEPLSNRQKFCFLHYNHATRPITKIPENWKPIGEFKPYSISSTKNGGGICRMREAVRIRDNYTCQICFVKWEKNSGKRKPDVHHIDPNEEGKNAWKFSNNLDHTKMITLCHRCHLRLGHLRPKFKELSTKKT